jgi:hypothetical protein
MGGEVEEVVGRWSNLTHPYIEVEDNAVAVLRFAGGALGVLSATTSSRLSHNSFVIHGTLGHSIGVSEEPEGAVGYNHVWTVPGEEMVSKRSLSDHVAGGEYMYESGGLEPDAPVDRQQFWSTEYQFKQPARRTIMRGRSRSSSRPYGPGASPGGRDRGAQVGRHPAGRLRVAAHRPTGHVRSASDVLGDSRRTLRSLQLSTVTRVRLVRVRLVRVQLCWHRR